LLLGATLVPMPASGAATVDGDADRGTSGALLLGGLLGLGIATKITLARRGLTSRVDLVQAVAAERSGELRLQINPHHPGDHRINEVGVPVCAVRLDDMLRERGWPEVSLIKIDVPGAEDRVLEGGGHKP
jgi:hypothetical protein